MSAIGFFGTKRNATPTPAAAIDTAELSRLEPADVAAKLQTSTSGLTEAEAEARLKLYGPNQISQTQHRGAFHLFISIAANPLNALLLTLAIVSSLIGDTRAAIVIAVMVVLAVTTGFIQEHRSSQAAERLRTMVKTHASAKRCTADNTGTFVTIPLETIVPGDIIRLSAGDMVPADVRLISAKDLFINQSTLTGEAMPAEKHCEADTRNATPPFERSNLCFMGASVVSGYAEAVVMVTGANTEFGRLAETITQARELTSFDKGINRFTWMMIRMIMVMVPAVFLINGLTKGNWLEALLFAVAVAVGLTPEMLPMIVTVNLAKGAMAMADKKVIVKRLHAIQNFGAMDVLCTDKTGTLTQDQILLKRHTDILGEENDRVLEYAYLNSHYQSGLQNLLDIAVLEHADIGKHLHLQHSYEKIDELPFDFTRRRLSVVLSREDGSHLLICKGAFEEMLSISSHCEINGEVLPLDPSHLAAAKAETKRLNEDGFRVVAVAYKELDLSQRAFKIADESDLTLIGYIAFLDPPKDSAKAALAALKDAGVRVKVLTGDNEIVTRKICRDVGLGTPRIVLGSEVAAMPQEQLDALVDEVDIYAKLSPEQKALVIKALHNRGHVIGYMGDGINDSAALKAADVGISVDTAVDIAKESADIILLEKSLMVLYDGVIEGRKVFGNINKYIKMGASSSFGNMFSVLGASLMLPFLPMLPIQVLTNNLLYDFSQTAIPTDNVDADYLKIPRKWDIDNIFKFVMIIGPISSLFDYATFFMMLYVFNGWANPGLFQTGWFVESLLTQTLIIHIIRTAKIPFFESRASLPLIMTTLVIATIGIALPFTPLGAALSFQPLPLLYWPLLALMIVAYAVLTHLVKTWFVRRWGM